MGAPWRATPRNTPCSAATRNIPQIGDIVSLVDVPSILLGENHKEGTFEREVAFATYGKKKAAINKSLIRSDGDVHI